MNANIWNSSQMAGTGGALKALAKNLANQLNLNRSEMKRVVARVISECHGQGHVGDYNGHMFYVKPDRIDMTKQITHSKEAFDDMLQQKRMRSKKPLPRSPSPTKSPTYKMTVDDKKAKSLTGVIIDQNHLRKRGQPSEIVVQMSKPAIRNKSKQAIKRKPAAQATNQFLIKKQPSGRPATLVTPKILSQKFQKKPKIAQLVQRKSVVKNVTKITKLTKLTKPKTPIVKNQKSRPALQTAKLTLAPSQPRMRAGNTVRPSTVAMKLSPKRAKSESPSWPQTPIPSAASQPRRPGILKKTKSVKLPKEKSSNSCRIVPEEKPKKKSKRLTAGGIHPKVSRTKTAASKKREKIPWRLAYKYQSDASPAYRPNPSVTKPKLKSKSTPVLVTKSRQVMTANSCRRLRMKRSQARMAKDLERDEAIDDPERLEAGSLHNSRSRVIPHPKPRVKRAYKISARLLELAQPSLHRRFVPEPAPLRTRPAVFKPKHKLRSGRRRNGVVIDSSLGSIEGMRPTSRSGLSPAKRNLTLAFLNKEGPRSPRNPRPKRSVLWR
ncbi:hypothetical protein AWZ03_013443 [Drosophila navojoa]|uniref:Uncharacterized protein n=1 Tax=Drosophila navojoa TaxID=7232 RepID=A0A484AUT2_DRONA|nr:serine/arginine repetitive matrix protein 1 [Drosophila navojoa]TDG40133.1 hypothetical protein AWZ03_013443 [Drosophila navojoa]